MDTQPRWEDPPQRHQRSQPPDWAEIAERLRANPGRWLLIFEGQRASLATALYLDHISAVRRADGFEVRTANNTRDYPRTCDTYLRYNPQREA
jgi:hypothetical protein